MNMIRILPTILERIHRQTPLIIGISGSVGVGKSFFARQLKSLIEAHARQNLKVVVVSTDGFLLPNKLLGNIKKGFPESYNFSEMANFLQCFKAGQTARAPVYSHTQYDIVPNEYIDATHADVLIFEGLCVLHQQVRNHLDLSIFLDAEEQVLLQWYIERALKNRAKAKTDPTSYFVRFLELTDDEFRSTAVETWNNINRPNLYENILPNKLFADIVLKKDAGHVIVDLLI